MEVFVSYHQIIRWVTSSISALLLSPKPVMEYHCRSAIRDTHHVPQLPRQV